MLEEKVERFLKKRNVVFNNKRVLVGVSGGPDSLALLHFLWKKQQKESFFLMVAHVDHMLRGMESFEEAKFVERFCNERNIPFKMKRVDVPEYMKQTGKSSEVAARECRYQFFEEVMNENDISLLCVAHHGDDQIETILMRLTRGSTGTARAGIPFTRPFHTNTIIRPFLCLCRKEIEQYCSDNHLDPRRDPSNEEDEYLRNRYRKYVVPLLKRENPHVHETFQRFSEDIQQDEKFLQDLTIEKMNTVWKEKKNNKVRIDIDAFREIPLPLQRRGFQLILNYLYEKRPESLSSIHNDQFFSLIESPKPSGRLDFPSGLKVIRSYSNCDFTFHHEENEGYRLEIIDEGDYLLPNGDSITLQFTNNMSHEKGTYHMLLSKKAVSLPLIIRTREPGDRISLKGLDGTKKIKSIFIDQKIPLFKRNNWPIITDIHNHVLWIPGLKKSREATITEIDNDYILLSYKPVK